MTKLLLKIFPMWYLNFIFADNSDNVRLIKEKAKLKLINNWNVKSNTKKKTYFSFNSNYQIPSLNFLFNFYSLKNTFLPHAKLLLMIFGHIKVSYEQ
jgi:hypothetical protein